MSNLLRNIPSVNELMESPPLRKVVDRVNRSVAVAGVRDFLEKMRSDVQEAASDLHVPSPTDLAESIADWILNEEQPLLRPVINATGIVLHTGLGRAPMATEAINAIEAIASGYASLEVDLKSGERSQRVKSVEKLLRQLTGAEAATVVNNNAGATVITLAAMASGREVIVSRSELVEIGGSFRLPDVMSASGATLREVGTTNKTRINDYRDAITPETAALMRVHSSNYAVVGFTESPTLEELVALSRQRNVPFIDDIGSGALVDFAKYGVMDEPLATESIKAGADLVLFSGDKLLGGPQCGIIAGRKSLVQKIAKHPLMRAFRVDKMTLAALAATLRLYQDPDTAEQSVPLLSLLSTSLENLKNRAERIAPQLAASDGIASAEPIESTSFVGGGSLPTQELATWCIALRPSEGNVDRLSARLRKGAPSVFGRISDDRLLLDLRSVFPRDDVDIVKAVNSLGTKSDTEQVESEVKTADGAAEDCAMED